MSRSAMHHRLDLLHRPSASMSDRPPRGARRASDKGQVVVIFAMSIVMFTLMCAVVVDLAWYWTNNLRMQRAADAAALAGVVWLPGDPSQAYATARAEASKNGYTDGVDGISVTPVQDPANARRLKVVITGPVGMFFARVAGIDSFPAKRTAKAEFVLPVPMGSPENYYGVGYYVKVETTTTTHHSSGDTGLDAPGSAPPGGSWAYTPTRRQNITRVVQSNNNRYATANADGQQQQWYAFGLLSGIPNAAGNQSLEITGLEVQLDDAFLSGSCSGSNTSSISAAVSWDGGSSWSSPVATPALGSSSSSGDYTLGSSSSTSAWGSHSWNRGDFSDSDFRVRLTSILSGCTGTLYLDELRVRVSWDLTTTTTTTALVQDAPVPPPPGQPAIAHPQKFWGAMQSQGAPSIQGDAYMTKYETRHRGGGGGTLNGPDGTDPDANYDPNGFYDYGVDIPAGGGGTVWVFDPGFCDATTEAGTGENWTVSSFGDSNPNGNPTREPVSAFYDLLDTRGTLLDESDDIPVASTGTSFRHVDGEDHVIYDALGEATHEPDCSSQPGHFGWVQLATGLVEGTYRVHTYSTDFSALDDQNNTTALNAFALYAASASGTPRIYGIGAMEAYVRLPGGGASEFYLAQIDAVHAGKTMVINLWDPGDTGNLSASLSILHPTGSGFAPTQFSYHATPGTSNPGRSNCAGRSGSGVTSVTTNTGGNSLYNGCWLTIEVVLPTSYDAPVDPVSGERGWWKIRYAMGGRTSDFSTDLTTWTVSIRGNPVHLVVP